VKTLFLLGHMRSCSSVLSHVLGSHPQINGYCETHTKYQTYFDLWKLRWRVRKLTGEQLKGEYVLDEVLHDYPIARSILDSRGTRAVVLIRRPRELKSGSPTAPLPGIGISSWLRAITKRGWRACCVSRKSCVGGSCFSRPKRSWPAPGRSWINWLCFWSCSHR
jgi:hypothetical protein